MQIEGFELASYFNIQLFEHGGTAIFTKLGTEYKVRKDLNRLSLEMNCEISAIELRKQKIVVVCVYRAGTDISVFFGKLTKLLHRLCREDKKNVVAGVFNLDILIETSKIRKFKGILHNFKCKFAINIPTRTKSTKRGESSTCIDNFIINFDCVEAYCIYAKL